MGIRLTTQITLKCNRATVFFQVVSACTESRDLEHLLEGLDITLSEGGCDEDAIVIGIVNERCYS